MMHKEANVFDVASLAGVSRGTVDRVVYGRGRVSEKTVAKVREAIRRLDYRPNPRASSLARKKICRIAYIIPRSRKGEYWDLIDKGFSMDRDMLSRYNIELHPFYYDISDEDSFRLCCRKALECEPSGVITNEAPKEALLEMVSALEQKNIPLSFIDTKYDDIDYALYCGIDAYKSGELGAFLLTNHQEVDSVVIIGIKRHNKAIDASATRRQGVADYLSSHFHGCRIFNVDIWGEPSKDNDAVLDAFTREHPQVKHFICPNSRVHLIARWLQKNPDPARVVVGYDDLDLNLQALKTGAADFLVTRKVPEQSGALLMDFAECIIHGEKPLKRNRFVHMDILHRMNLDDYR